jgi:hypothetical protein
MNIVPLVQSFSSQSSHDGNSLPQTQKASPADTSENIGKISKQVNLHDVSINEINALIRSGKNELLDVVPFIPPNILEQYNYDPESIGNHRVDLLGQMEKSIDFKKSIGEDTTFMEKALENIKNIDGTYLPTKIDITV